MEVKSFDELKKMLNRFGCPYPGNQGHFFFRGLPNKNYELIPPLFYPPVSQNPKEKETQILNEFLNATNFGIDKNPNQRVWLNAFYARHWGLKSRLIDWTIDLSVALYFMLQNSGKENAALFVLPKSSLDFINEIPNETYFEFKQTAILHPPFFLDDIAVIGSKNRFIQNGRFLIQDYENAGKCFYKRNSASILKIEIAQDYLKDIYYQCCDIQDYDPLVKLVMNADKDPNYALCEQLNML